MKLPKKLIEKYKKDFHYNDLKQRDWETDTWEFDKDAYYKEKDCFRMHNCYNSWIEIPNYDMKHFANTQRSFMSKEEALVILTKAIDYASDGSNREGTWCLSTEGIEAIKVAIKYMSNN